MTTPDLRTEAAAAPRYPSRRFSPRERKLLASVTAWAPFSVVAAGTFTTVGGDTTESITIPGALSSDLAFVQKISGNAVVATAVAATDAITVTTDADPGGDDVWAYQLLRAST